MMLNWFGKKFYHLFVSPGGSENVKTNWHKHNFCSFSRLNRNTSSIQCCCHLEEICCVLLIDWLHLDIVLWLLGAECTLGPWVSYLTQHLPLQQLQIHQYGWPFFTVKNFGMYEKMLGELVAAVLFLVPTKFFKRRQSQQQSLQTVKHLLSRFCLPPSLFSFCRCWTCSAYIQEKMLNRLTLNINF